MIYAMASLLNAIFFVNWWFKERYRQSASQVQKLRQHAALLVNFFRCVSVMCIFVFLRSPAMNSWEWGYFIFDGTHKPKTASSLGSALPSTWSESVARIALVGVEGCMRYQWDANDHADEIYASYGLWNQLVVELWAAVGGGFWPWSAWFSLGLVAVSHQPGIEYRISVTSW
jgi:hypothetical protein